MSITKFIHGWLPTGSRRAIISKGSISCPHCKDFETTEHLLACNNSKIKYNRGLRKTFLDSQLRKQVPGGHHITHVLMAYVHHLISNQSPALAIPSRNNSSGTAKAAIIKAVSHQQQIVNSNSHMCMGCELWPFAGIPCWPWVIHFVI